MNSEGLRATQAPIKELCRARRDEDSHPAEQHLLLGSEQVVAPVDERTERLLAWKRSAAPARKDLEAFVETLGEVGDAQDLHPSRGEFNRQRNAVQTTADLADCRRVRVV